MSIRGALVAGRLRERVHRIVDGTPVHDIHTHLYAPDFGELLLWGIDELLVYHYLVSEAFRHLTLPYEDFWRLRREDQAALVWRHLFVEHSPVSEACRGVLTTLQAFGLDARRKDLPALRRWFAGRKVSAHVDATMQAAGVHTLCMTNSPFDDLERPVWVRGRRPDPRFTSALRIDPLLLQWPAVSPQLRGWGYEVTRSLTRRTIGEVSRFLEEWAVRMDARYLMVSLPPEFAFPAKTACAMLIERAVLPVCRELGLPFAMMPGVKRAVNPALRLAGDGVALSDLGAIERLCAGFPENKFLITVLARENQHELCVLARKFRNLHPFGCWWFTNIPTLIDEMTRMRLELLGTSVTLQHSDARVLDQIIYKWRHSRAIIADALCERYAGLEASGWRVTDGEIGRDARELLGGAFETFCGRGGKRA